MSTSFEDRVARLNAKNGGASRQMAGAATAEPARSAASAAPKLERKARGARPAWLTYAIIGFLVLVVMPVGAAMGTIYLSNSTDRVANLFPIAGGTPAIDETGR